jgi:hypothetical protein
LAILPLAAGCSGSSFPSFGSSNPQAAAVPPPPNSSVAAAGQPAYAPPGQPAYAPQAQAGAAQPGSYAAAAPAQPASSDGATVGSFKGSYVNFLKAFRDPEPDPAGYDARASVYPQQSLSDAFKGSGDAGQRPDPNGAGYPQQALIRPSNGAPPPQQNAYIPHPPSTYVPAGQPYTPPQEQPAYAAPAAQQNYAAPPAQPNAQRSGQQSSAASSAKQAKATRASSQQSAAAAPPPAQPAYAAPAAAPATAAPPAQQDYSDSLPYPKQSLTDLFRDSTQPQGQTVPRPPSTYTASGQPYTPQGQAAGATAVAAAPPANPDSPNQLAYPKQSLFEVFSSK